MTLNLADSISKDVADIQERAKAFCLNGSREVLNIEEYFGVELKTLENYVCGNGEEGGKQPFCFHREPLRVGVLTFE